MGIIINNERLEEIVGKYQLRKTGVKLLSDRVYLYHKKEVLKDEERKVNIIPSIIIYRIVSTFYRLAKERPNDKTPCKSAWLFDGAKKDFRIYALIARRYGFSDVKYRGNKWYENGELVVINNNGSQYAIEKLE